MTVLCDKSEARGFKVEVGVKSKSERGCVCYIACLLNVLIRPRASNSSPCHQPVKHLTSDLHYAKPRDLKQLVFRIRLFTYRFTYLRRRPHCNKSLITKTADLSNNDYIIQATYKDSY